MSYLPAFSEKAKKELQRLRGADKRLHGLGSGITNTLDLLPDLFDLEKYPITTEMLFEYLSKSDFQLKYSEDGQFLFEVETEYQLYQIYNNTNIIFA